MNYLAHAYLSFGEPQILAGNMISDFVKGAQKFVYPVSIQKGIQLHREIDSFTDTHAATAKAKVFFRPHYRLYSGAIVDIIYDHFLANDRDLFTQATLQLFTADVYKVLEKQRMHLPDRFLMMLTYMRMDNWLYHYRTTGGIQKSLQGMVRRALYINDSTKAFEIFINHYDELRKCYEEFFPDVKQMAKQKLNELLA
jgi:acyl carrier protein phosphodiesterase